MYNPQYTESFYDAYDKLEWYRLEATAYGRLKAIIHDDFLKRYIKSGNRVLDAASGPGRFSISMAKLGAQVTLLDISGKQLKIAREKIQAENLLEKMDKFVKADICDLAMFPDGLFDAVVCFGGALSYVLENREKAAKELKRVTRSGGIILVSVMSRLGLILDVARLPSFSLLKNPDKDTADGSGLWHILENGYFTFLSRRVGMMHATMHLYTADELKHLFTDCEVLELAGSSVTVAESSSATALGEIAKDPEAWSTLVELERKINSSPGLVDNGAHIILAARK
jgi:ubiquinone/menaquinone biosynthesis C-methylase UbiE